jgi:hypothetical protein
MKWIPWVGAMLGGLVGCLPDEPRDRSCTGDNELPPGVTVAGFDAQAELAPMFGTWEGEMSWAWGGSTRLVFSVVQDPETPLYRSHCSNPDGVYTYADGLLATDDGRLDESITVSVLRRFPTARYDGESIMSPSGMPQWSWQGTLGDDLPVNVSGYEDPVLAFEVELAGQRPVSGLLDFHGVPIGASTLDRLPLGIVEFD